MRLHVSITLKQGDEEYGVHTTRKLDWEPSEEQIKKWLGRECVNAERRAYHTALACAAEEAEAAEAKVREVEQSLASTLSKSGPPRRRHRSPPE